MFESVRPPEAAERLRNAAAIPFGALLLALLYLTLYPTFTRVPAALFWSVDAILFLGAIAGLIAIIRIAAREKIRGRAIGWLVAAALITLVCGRLFLGLTFPWL